MDVFRDFSWTIFFVKLKKWYSHLSTQSKNQYIVWKIFMIYLFKLILKRMEEKYNFLNYATFVNQQKIGQFGLQSKLVQTNLK